VDTWLKVADIKNTSIIACKDFLIQLVLPVLPEEVELIELTFSICFKVRLKAS